MMNWERMKMETTKAVESKIRREPGRRLQMRCDLLAPLISGSRKSTTHSTNLRKLAIAVTVLAKGQASLQSHG